MSACARRLVSWLAPLTLALAALSLGAGVGASQGRGETELEALRARWERKSPDERAVLRLRFREFSRLEPEVRRELDRRARQLNGALRTLEHEPPPWVRERLEGTPPGERERVLRGCLEDHHRWRGGELRDRMPPDLLARLEAARTEEERAEVYKELFRRGREEMFPRFVRGVGRRLDLEAEEIERLQATPVGGQEAVLQNLKRRLWVERGRPEGIAEADWVAWQALPDAEFVQRVELSGALWPESRWRGRGRPPWRRDDDGPGSDRGDGDGRWRGRRPGEGEERGRERRGSEDPEHGAPEDEPWRRWDGERDGGSHRPRPEGPRGEREAGGDKDCRSDGGAA